MLAREMKVDDLYIGDIEGKNEFNEQNIKHIENTFLKLDHIEKNFIDRKQYFIYGHKGTGKTSLLKFIEYKVREKKEKALTILFKDIKQETLTYSTFKDLLRQAEDQDTAAMTFWKWFILSIIMNEIFPNINVNELIFNSQNTMFQNLSKFLLQLIGGTKVSASSHDIDLEIQVPEMLKNENKELYSAGIKIRNLEKYIKDNIKNNIYILIDELETSTLSKTFNEDAILIKNLIISVDYLNRLSSKLTIITAVRTEILNNVFASGAEINKLLESKGEETKWTFDTFGEAHPLIKMMIKKFRYSMLEYTKGDESIKMATDKEIFTRWFPTKLMDSEEGDNAKYLLHNTWTKPRDIVRFLQIMKKNAKHKSAFDRVSYDNSVKEYSAKAWIELKEELISILTDEEIEDIENTIANFTINFTYDDLINRFLDKTELQMKEIKKIIKTLYNIGVLGNCYNNGNRRIYRYSYRGDSILDEDEKMEIHRGLWKNFSLKQELKTVTKNNKNSIYSTMSDQLRAMDREKRS